MNDFHTLFASMNPQLVNAIFLLNAIIFGWVLHWVIFRWLKYRSKKNSTFVKKQILRYLDKPTRYFLPMMIFYISMHYLELHKNWILVINILLVINISWLLINLLQAVEAVVENKFARDRKHEVRERMILTQLKFFKNLAYAVIVTLAIAIVLWNIPGVRELGMGLLTTAGIAGIIFGFAAQKSIANLISGLQIAFTQSIKIDDIIVVEGEWGVVEDITLTYVVVKTWDWRRLVLPLNYFNDKPFENWTLNSQELLGKITLHLDYGFPIPKLRAEFHRILEGHQLWDKGIAELLVTNASERSIELRLAFSAKNSADAWRMRCEIREQLLAFIQNNYSEYLPLIRTRSESQ